MQRTRPTALVDRLEQLFSLLARTDAGADAGPALTSTQRVVLIELVSAGPLRLGALAARIGASDPTVSRAVAGMVAAGIVERNADPDDRRAVLLAATAAGRGWVKRRRDEVAAALADALGRMPAEGEPQLVSLLGSLNDELRAAGSEPRSAALLASR
jgi:DNA-binding MarR family transcriptional regulator